jgi:hypothetical protein
VNPWPFVVAAYALTGLGAGGLVLWSFLGMRRAEAEAERLKGER